MASTPRRKLIATNSLRITLSRQQKERFDGCSIGHYMGTVVRAAANCRHRICPRTFFANSHWIIDTSRIKLSSVIVCTIWYNRSFFSTPTDESFIFGRRHERRLDVFLRLRPPHLASSLPPCRPSPGEVDAGESGSGKNGISSFAPHEPRTQDILILIKG